MKDIGKTIQLYLDENDMTQAELGKLVGASQQTISLIVNNRRLPSLDTLVQICKVLNIDIAFLLETDTNDHNDLIISDIQEKMIIDCYRSLNKDKKHMFESFVSAIKESN